MQPTSETIEQRLERVLVEAVAKVAGDPCPPKLGRAVRYAVIPGGARMRPRLCYETALALRNELTSGIDGVAVGLEFLHCASLVHDDLPAFDDAATRRSCPTVHKVFGEAIAILTGDALIVGAFDAVVRGRSVHSPELVALLANAAGAPEGLVAGQAWEQEPSVDVVHYHRAKTARLFEAATAAAAILGGYAVEPWVAFGRDIGEVYQIADDILDATSSQAVLGKPSGRDAQLGRPSAVGTLGLAAARALLDQRIDRTIAAVPPCSGAERLRGMIHRMLTGFRKLAER